MSGRGPGEGGHRGKGEGEAEAEEGLLCGRGRLSAADDDKDREKVYIRALRRPEFELVPS